MAPWPHGLQQQHGLVRRQRFAVKLRRQARLGSWRLAIFAGGKERTPLERWIYGRYNMIHDT